MLHPLPMADHVSFSDDISKLWGPDDEGVLTPTPPASVRPEDERPADPSPTNGNGNGSGVRITVVEQDTRDDVARLAHALATNHADVVHRSDLDAARSQMEGAFTHQIAVALYELMAASNARFATAEDKINQRVTEAVEGHTDRLEASLERHHRESRELSEALWAQVDAMRQRMDGPIDGLAAFQRELRHEIGRLSDLVASASAAAVRAEAESERQGDALAERIGHSEERAAAVAGEVGDVASTLATLRDDVSALREQLAELRQAIEDGKTRSVRRWGRTR
jgi:DNA anti-recombination protein RmuC